MKKRILNALIIFLGVMASFVFYGFWEKEPNPSIANTKDTMAIPIDTFDTHVIEQKEIKHIVTLPHQSIDKNIPIKEVLVESEPLDIPYDTSEAMEAHTQEVYVSLQPDNHDESIDTANEAFGVMDEQVHHVEKQLKDHMELASFQQNIMDDTIDLGEEHFEMKLPVINE